MAASSTIYYVSFLICFGPVVVISLRTRCSHVATSSLSKFDQSEDYGCSAIIQEDFPRSSCKGARNSDSWCHDIEFQRLDVKQPDGELLCANINYTQTGCDKSKVCHNLLVRNKDIKMYEENDSDGLLRVKTFCAVLTDNVWRSANGNQYQFEMANIKCCQGACNENVAQFADCAKINSKQLKTNVNV